MSSEDFPASHGLDCVSGKMDEKRAPEADLRSVSGNTTHNYNDVY